MRHPTTGLNEDDLSRLTGSSNSSTISSASTTPSHDNIQELNRNDNDQQQENSSTSDPASSEGLIEGCPSRIDVYDAELVNNLKNSSLNLPHQLMHHQQPKHCSSHFNSSYLPEIIDPLEWQKSRKRKERLDSTSSTTQDRKLIRSNSEELLPNSGGNNSTRTVLKECVSGSQDKSCPKTEIIIRRVSSEDFKRSTTYHDDGNDDNFTQVDAKPRKHREGDFLTITVNNPSTTPLISDENDSLAANRQPLQETSTPPPYSPGIDMTRRSRNDTSPARSHRIISPSRNGGCSSNKYQRGESDDSECEHERRRSSERFCKSRAPPGRKSGVMKKSGKYLPTKMRPDENTYKYDLSALKYERRGFVSKLKAAEERERERERCASSNSDYNDNNLIDFHIISKSDAYQNVNSTSNLSQTLSPGEKNVTSTTITSPPSPTITTTAEPLPWDRSIPEDQTPILSRRYATVRHTDCIDTAAKLSKVMPYPQPFLKQHQHAATMMLADDIVEPINTFRAFTSLENIKAREVMKQVIPAMMSFQTPEERLKQVNKRLTALKKKVVQLEEGFETKHGYRLSQSEKLNDKHMKNILAEISKLRKEKHELKTDSIGAISFKVSGGMDSTQKLEKMKATLKDMEENLSEKREDGNRSESLEELTADQLVQEKTAVQHGLLYFESVFGRPSTKEERDIARPLYNRYRVIKRLVSRSVAMSGSNMGGAPELPTILEHEAMVFESTPQQQYSNSTDTTNSTPNETTTTNSASATTGAASEITTDDSTSAADNSDEEQVMDQKTTAPLGENIHTLSLDKLWEHLDKAREEKKLLKRTIREFESVFEEQNGRKMLKNDRKAIQDTYNQYKEKKAQTRFLQALIKKHISR